MKSQLSFVLAAGVAAALSFGASTASAADLRAEIPFAFSVGDKTLPAGTYQVTVSQGIVGVRNEKGGVFVMTGRLESTASHKATLVFERGEGDYVLREAWTGGGNGRSLAAGRSDEPRLGAVAQDTTRVEIPLL